jgi:hypothetical protein
MGAPTLPVSPSGTRIFSSTPSSKASTSRFDLSVSTSAIASPEEMLSPSFFSHLRIFPSVIVGESAGS